ncbi:MAG: Nif3-like dinuclear metal center hexameric protein [Lentisphaeria bacterium]
MKNTAIPLRQLTRFLDDLLARVPFPADRSNNGLQVAGGARLRRAAFAVDASAALFERAAADGVGFLFVHHGLSWNGGWQRLTGLAGRRVALLMKNDLSLYASHLPLDAHPEVGNNAGLAQDLGLAGLAPFFEYRGAPIGWRGTLPRPLSPAALAARVRDLLGAGEGRLFNGGGIRTVRRVAVVSGGAADAVETAALAGCDALVTGEVGHSHYHEALESGVAVIAAGHYATETVGPRRVLDAVAAAFPGLDCRFYDLPTGL